MLSTGSSYTNASSDLRKSLSTWHESASCILRDSNHVLLFSILALYKYFKTFSNCIKLLKHIMLIWIRLLSLLMALINCQTKNHHKNWKRFEQIRSNSRRTLIRVSLYHIHFNIVIFLSVNWWFLAMPLIQCHIPMSSILHAYWISQSLILPRYLHNFQSAYLHLHPVLAKFAILFPKPPYHWWHAYCASSYHSHLVGLCYCCLGLLFNLAVFFTERNWCQLVRSRREKKLAERSLHDLFI